MEAQHPNHDAKVVQLDAQQRQHCARQNFLERPSYLDVMNRFETCPIAKNIRFNEFSHRIECLDVPWKRIGDSKNWNDFDSVELRGYFNSALMLNIGASQLNDILSHAARENSYNPAQDRIRFLAGQWDGMPRLRTWLVDYLNAQLADSHVDYLSELGYRWLIGVIARVMEPGCKRDDALILISSEQGLRKTTLAEALSEVIAPDSFGALDGDLNVDAKRALQGKVIVELSEMASTSKGDREKVKSFISAKFDDIRPLYGNHFMRHNRTCSFLGTSNLHEVLDDPTGNRRFWPVVVGVIDYEKTVEIIPQLYGEAATMFFKGEEWRITDPKVIELAKKIQANHNKSDAWAELVEECAWKLWQDARKVQLHELMDRIGISTRNQNPQSTSRVKDILLSLRWRPTSIRNGSKVKYKTFVPPEYQPHDDEVPF